MKAQLSTSQTRLIGNYEIRNGGERAITKLVIGKQELIKKKMKKSVKFCVKSGIATADLIRIKKHIPPPTASSIHILKPQKNPFSNISLPVA
ncbi:MAG: hypothetical protein V4721_00130 [Bacteroidota bacterium]